MAQKVTITVETIDENVFEQEVASQAQAEIIMGRCARDGYKAVGQSPGGVKTVTLYPPSSIGRMSYTVEPEKEAKKPAKAKGTEKEG